MGAFVREFVEQLQSPEWSQAVAQHIKLSALALLVGIIISVPLAIAVSRYPRTALLSINVANLGRGVPDLALLAFFLVIFGLGFWPAEIALILLSIPPILINTVTALNQVENKVIDSARGMGLSEWQILTSVQLPIAAPVIFAGIRTSAVQVVAGATLATFIGAGGLGVFIVQGLAGFGYPTMFAGAIPVAVLAIAAEFAFGGLERLSTPKGLKVAKKRAKRGR
ncbi:ABC transporter permease [Rubrobacter aplysinae]|uniref:ABC transporter permease n=1 Tax=Rubrobacter aplysinae TaxID=909625 RepID=UPI00064BF140|nr:ABC transporter permease [Rubrobacter aplysinae]